LAVAVLRQEAVAYSAQSKSVVWSESADFEGMGSTEAFEKKPGADAISLVEFEIGDEREEPARIKAEDKLAKYFLEQNFIALERQEWDGEERIAVGGAFLQWKRRKLSLIRANKKAKKLEYYPIDKPHVPDVRAIYSSKNAPIVVVEVNYDPGQAYIEGYTVRTEMDVFDLSAD
jgi:hypothetical protein